MVAIKKTNTIINNTNIGKNDAKILISRKNRGDTVGVDWKSYDICTWSKYQIKESDFRSKTATFTSPQYLDLTTGVYCVLITTTLHENFAGQILDVSYDSETGLYEYQCQDFSRMYQGTFDLINIKWSLHRILQFLITRGGLSNGTTVSKAKLKEWKYVLSGLRPAYQYDQRYYGMIKWNPMTLKQNMIIRNKSWIEAIRDLVYGTGAYIDVYFNNNGIIQIEPYTKDDFYNTGLHLTTPEIAKYSMKFDTTNVITGTLVKSADNTNVGKYYHSNSLVNLDLSVFFGSLLTTVDNPNQSSNKSSKTTSKKSTTATKTSNPYNTKKKVVWINSDNILGKSADKKFINDIAALLKKQGWTTKIVGVGPNLHTEKYMGPKNGVWFCIYGGSDAAVFKEASGKNSYTNKLKKLGSRTVIGMRQTNGRPCDIRKGGKCYKYLGRAHDDNYSGSGFRGVSYPLKMLTDAKVPIMYASTAKDMVAKFLKGGDNPKAC